MGGRLTAPAPGAGVDGATLDGMVSGSGAVFEAKSMLPWSFSEDRHGAVKRLKYLAQIGFVSVFS
jgi:hypothetical protein